MLRVSLGIGASGVMFANENLAYEFVKDFGIYLVVGGVVGFSIGGGVIGTIMLTPLMLHLAGMRW